MPSCDQDWWVASAGGRRPGVAPLIRPDEYGPEQELANRLRRGFRELLRRRGADLAYGRKLPRLLREAGLADVAADAYFPVPSPECTVLEEATVRQVRDKLVAARLATDEEIDCPGARRGRFGTSAPSVTCATLGRAVSVGAPARKADGCSRN